MTYLDVIKQACPNQKIWGALYLQFKNQPINLSEINQLSEIANILKESMRYDGLVLEDAAEQIKGIENISHLAEYQSAEFTPPLLRIA